MILEWWCLTTLSKTLGGWLSFFASFSGADGAEQCDLLISRWWRFLLERDLWKNAGDVFWGARQTKTGRHVGSQRYGESGFFLFELRWLFRSFYKKPCTFLFFQKWVPSHPSSPKKTTWFCVSPSQFFILAASRNDEAEATKGTVRSAFRHYGAELKHVYGDRCMARWFRPLWQGYCRW